MPGPAPLRRRRPGPTRRDRRQHREPDHQPGQPVVLGGRRLVQLRRRHLPRRWPATSTSRDNVVRTSDIGIEVGRGEPARPRRRGPRAAQPGQRQRVRRPRARRLQPEPRRGVRRAGHRQPLPRRQHPAGRLARAAAAVQAARDVDRGQHGGGDASRDTPAPPAQPSRGAAAAERPRPARPQPYLAPVRASRAQFVWLGHRLTGFRTYVHRSREDTHSRCAQRRP